MELRKRPEVLCDHGSSDKKEDGYFARLPYFAVIDGYSEPHSYKKSLKLVQGRTGGEIIPATVNDILGRKLPHPDLVWHIILINEMLKSIFVEQGFPVDDAGRLPGASFVFAEMKEERVRIVQGGDSLAVWLDKSGRINFTPNQAYFHVCRNLQTITEIMARNGNNAKEMWVEFAPQLEQRRRQDINSPLGYASLNGQPGLFTPLRLFDATLKDLQFLLMFSDGFIPYGRTSSENMPELARELLQKCRQGTTLEEMLAEKRKVAEINEKSSYIKHDEATAILLEF